MHICYLLLWVQLVLFEAAWSEPYIYITCNCVFNWFCLRRQILPVTVSLTGFVWGGMVWTMHTYYLLFEVAWSEPCIHITCCLRWHGLNHAYILPVTVSSTGFVWGGMVWTMHTYFPESAPSTFSISKFHSVLSITFTDNRTSSSITTWSFRVSGSYLLVIHDICKEYSGKCNWFFLFVLLMFYHRGNINIPTCAVDGARTM